MRDNTLLTKSATGLVMKVQATQMKKWAEVVAKPAKDNLADPNINAFWHVDYCYWENKPNPEAANEKIPQTNMIKSFPDDWHMTGDFDYDSSKYGKFLFQDPRCPVEGGKLFTYEAGTADGFDSSAEGYSVFPERDWCDTWPQAMEDGTQGTVLAVQRDFADWCWASYWGFQIDGGVALLDGFTFHIWVKWSGDNIPYGGVWNREAWAESEWYACPRGEWCEITITSTFGGELTSWDGYQKWSTEAYLETYYHEYFNADVWIDPASIYGCAFDPTKTTLNSLGK